MAKYEPSVRMHNGVHRRSTSVQVVVPYILAPTQAQSPTQPPKLHSQPVCNGTIRLDLGIRFRVFENAGSVPTSPDTSQPIRLGVRNEYMAIYLPRTSST